MARRIGQPHGSSLLRKAAAGATLELSIPASIAQSLTVGTLFYCELTDEGILFRPESLVPTAAIPDWAGR